MPSPLTTREAARRPAPLRPTAHCPLPTAHFSPRRGLTLIEMLIATAITLLMMAAIVTLFANLSGSISNRRALIELSGQLRQVRQRLARDLAGCTVPPGPGGLMPWRQRPGEAIGYFEIVEGHFSDAVPSGLLRDDNDDGVPDFLDVKASLVPGSQLIDADSGQVTDGRALGDHDDILAMTVRALDSPFVANYQFETSPGNFETKTVESNLAEVIWYAIENPRDDPDTTDIDESLLVQDNIDTPNVDESLRGEPGMRTIYRRVLLIAPWEPIVGNAPRVISSHVEEDQSGNRRRVANTLSDLTRREYRFAHELDFGDNDLDYPHELDLRDIGGELFDRSYVVLNNALAWDVRVFDPGAPLYEVTGGLVVEPGDPAWEAAIGTSTLVGFGAYVDLGWDNGPNNIPRYDYTTVTGAPKPLFQQEHQLGWHPSYWLPPINDPSRFRGTPAVYDTWSWHYENDGRNQDEDFFVVNGQQTPLIDEGLNGRDDEVVAGGSPPRYEDGVDDVMERETSPPYPVPLRGVRAILRTYEPDARQIREASVTHSFVP